MRRKIRYLAWQVGVSGVGEKLGGWIWVECAVGKQGF